MSDYDAIMRKLSEIHGLLQLEKVEIITPLREINSALHNLSDSMASFDHQLSMIYSHIVAEDFATPDSETSDD